MPRYLVGAAAARGVVRHFGFNRFPYSLVVADLDGMRIVVAVAHHKRELGYWRD